ncbi:unnamed protein product [Rotaria socialis]|uniref:Uncharacterized protein n=1 Tax=Rotaria socialis TaxID=392032 RepID=A0A818TAK3_9BILA|nr:unnamed protein product [Rotaria socialis]CAF4833429.1 unnamed protein product [Rotaria socialis]
MLNLEKLGLYLSISVDERFIDGNNLKENILNHMSQLNQFIFHIRFQRKQGQCHIYSYPFLMKYYEDTTNNFPSGLCPYVRVVSLYDEYPFEHAFFIRIAQSFPLMEKINFE